MRKENIQEMRALYIDLPFDHTFMFSNFLSVVLDGRDAEHASFSQGYELEDVKTYAIALALLSLLAVSQDGLDAEAATELLKIDMVEIETVFELIKNRVEDVEMENGRQKRLSNGSFRDWLLMRPRPGIQKTEIELATRCLDWKSLCSPVARRYVLRHGAAYIAYTGGAGNIREDLCGTTAYLTLLGAAADKIQTFLGNAEFRSACLSEAGTTALMESMLHGVRFFLKAARIDPTRARLCHLAFLTVEAYGLSSAEAYRMLDEFRKNQSLLPDILRELPWALSDDKLLLAYILLLYAEAFRNGDSTLQLDSEERCQAILAEVALRLSSGNVGLDGAEILSAELMASILTPLSALEGFHGQPVHATNEARPGGDYDAIR